MTSPQTGAGSTLVLIPTEVERRHFAGQSGFAEVAGQVHLCGLGLVMAAARASQLIAQLEPDRVLLLGIAGTYRPEQLSPGQAACFNRVALEGIGAATEEGISSLDKLQITPAGSGQPDQPLSLALPPAVRPAGLLLSCCAAAGTHTEAQRRLQRFPAAIAEDMEGYAVALAGHLTRRPVAIVRGISNLAGNRDRDQWCVAQAVAAAWRLARPLLDVAWHWEQWCDEGD